MALGPGVLILFVALFVLGPLIARPVAKALGRPITRVKGMTGTMATENAARDPKRTARTAAALVVGVALVTGVSVLATSISDSVRKIFGEQFRGDFVISVDNFGFGGLSPQLSDDLNKLPEVGTAAGIGVNYTLVDGKGRTVTVVDPATIGAVFDLDFVQGQISDLTPDGVLVSKSKAKSDGLTVGSPFPLTLTDGTAETRAVRASTRGRPGRDITVDRELFAGTSVDQYDFGVFITKAEGVSAADAEQAIAAVAKQYPNGELQSRTDYINTQAQGIQQVVNIIYLLLARLGGHRCRRHRDHAGPQRVRASPRARAGAGAWGVDQTAGALQRPLGVGDHGHAGDRPGGRGGPAPGLRRGRTRCAARASPRTRSRGA